MGVQYWPEPKNAGADDRYQMTIPLSWLEGEAISSATWVAEADSGLTISGETIVGSTVNASFSGGNAGVWLVTVTISTATRSSKDFCGKLSVRGCG